MRPICTTKKSDAWESGTDDIYPLLATCRLCGREFFGLRGGSNLCSMHYFEYGRMKSAKTSIKRPDELIMDLINLYEQGA